MLDNTEHLLTCLAEECAEISEQCSKVAVRVSKALRFGLAEVQPGQLRTNAERIAAELADLLALAEVLEGAGVITRAEVENKKEKVRRFMDYAEKCGALSGDDQSA
jgi:NTP pyrophosphatase (non-canonical NTP hydrolase)